MNSAINNTLIRPHNFYDHTLGWGTGDYFKKLVGKMSVPVEFLIDSNPVKWGDKINGLDVCEPSILRSYDSNNTLIVVFSSFYEEILRSIRSFGEFSVINGKDWFENILLDINNQIELAVQNNEKGNVLAELYVQRAEILHGMGKGLQKVESLKLARDAEPNNTQWTLLYADTCFNAGRLHDAADAYREVIKTDVTNASCWYRLGISLEAVNDKAGASNAYLQAVVHNHSPVISAYGTGALHFMHGRWDKAIVSYKTVIIEGQANALTYYRLGKSYERCFEWKYAADAYRKAISLNGNFGLWYYRLGFTLERIGAYSDAVDAYALACDIVPQGRSLWHYRLASVLSEIGEYEKACDVFLKASQDVSLCHSDADSLSDQDSLQNQLANDCRDPLDWIRLADLYKSQGLLHKSAEAYKAAISRQQTHDTGLYFSLGTVLFLSGEYMDACAAFREIRQYKRASYIPMRGSYQTHASYYSECYATLDIRKDVVLYESFHGVSISCNPYAIFLELLKRDQFSEFLHVWVTNGATPIPDWMVSLHNVVFIPRGSESYWRYLATAGYLVNNTTFPKEFCRRDGQVNLMTWHGTPLKTLGKHRKGVFFEHKNVARNLFQATHVISPNRHTTDCLLNSHDIGAAWSGQLAETGYPRIDLTLNATPDQRRQLKDRLGISLDKPVVLYAPTWRGTLTDIEFEAERVISDMDILCRMPIQLIYRGHYFVKERMEGTMHDVCVPSDDISTNELLSIVDVLITDYSSIAFDFLVLQRPILYYVYDLEEYQEEIGLYFTIDGMPGMKIHSLDKLVYELDIVLDGLSEWEAPDEYRLAMMKYCPYDDGQVTERVVDWVFNGSTRINSVDIASGRRAALIYAGAWLGNGITTSFLNFMNIGIPDSWDTTIAINPGVVEATDVSKSMFNRMPDEYKVVGHVGGMVISAEDAWVRRYYLKNKMLHSEAHWQVLAKIYRQEFLRLFGNARFTTIVNYDGYSHYWALLFAFAPVGAGRKIIFLHNDMYSEWRMRFASLGCVFGVYHQYDELVSTAKSTRDVNRQNLAPMLRLDSERFKWVRLTIDWENVLKQSCAPLHETVSSVIKAGRGPLLVTVGRLSPEKDHLKLLRAFSRLIKDANSAQLFILGDGPLRTDMGNWIKELGLDGAVHLLGFVKNPYPVVKACDLFVLSSNYEGLGVVLLEAMVLGKTVVSTDIPGCRDALGGGYGLLIDNSEDGLLEGMNMCLDGTFRPKPFDINAWNTESKMMFNSFLYGI